MMERILEQILDEERRLRAAAEEELRELRRLLEDLAARLAPERLEAERRKGRIIAFGPSDWRAFFENALRPRTAWAPPGPGRDGAPLPASPSPSGNGHAVRPAPEPRPLPASPPPSAPAGRDIPEPPARPPARFAERFRDWRREGMALALLAVSGISVRLEAAEILAARWGISPRSGSMKRLFERMAGAGLLEERAVRLGSAGIMLVRLSSLGREAARACGWEPVEDEWSRMERLHGDQTAHTALALVGAYHARRRGMRAEVMPEIRRGGPAAPDLRIEDPAGETFWVEAERESGEDRMPKWRNLAALEGIPAVLTVSAAARRRLASEMQAAGCRTGAATDLEHLISQESFWAERW